MNSLSPFLYRSASIAKNRIICSHRRSHSGILQSFAISTLIATVVSPVTFCDNKDGKDEDDTFAKWKDIVSYKQFDRLVTDLGLQIQPTLDSGVPAQLSYGFVTGFGSGYAFKKIGRAVSVVFGLGFVTLQFLTYSGYVSIDHGALRKKVDSAMDLNNDGVVDAKDLNIVKEKVLDVLTYTMPAGGGFSAGFFGGFRSG